MSDRIASAALQKVYKPDEVALDVSERIFERIPYSGLRRQVAYRIEALFGEKARHGGAVIQTHADETVAVPTFALHGLVSGVCDIYARFR